MAAKKKKARRKRRKRQAEHREWRIDCSAAISLQIPLMLETLAKLVNADKLRIDYTDYELCDEFKEALEHAQVRVRTTLVTFSSLLGAC